MTGQPFDLLYESDVVVRVNLLDGKQGILVFCISA
jgi:hypothetical protein